MKIRIDPKQLFLSGKGHTDIREYLLVFMDEETMLAIQEEIGFDYEDIEMIINHVGISVLISKLPDAIEVEVLDEE